MNWLRRLFHKSRAENELDKELRFHLNRQIADYVASGISLEEAHRRAQQEFGGIERVKEEVRDTHLETHFDNLVRDFRYAFRNLRKDRRFTLIAIVTLALGIGSTTVIFSVIDSVLFHPFPYKNADRLVSFSVLAADQVRAWRFPAAAFFDFKEQNHTFEDMFGLVFRGVHYASEQGSDEFFGGWVTPGTFESLGIKPLLGRSLMPEDAKPESPPVFVMSYRLWSKHFHRDPKIIGTTVTMNRISMILVGVMPERFQFGIGECEVWMPLYLTRTSFVPGAGIEPNEVWTVGHLRPGVSAETAAADLQVIANRLGKTDSLYFPEQSRLVINAFNDNYVSYFFRIMLYALMAAAAMLLLIACSNVANLSLVRATAREKEMVIRAALGATRSRLIRQLLIESFLLTLASCVAGCTLAYFGLIGVVAAIPEKTIPSEASIALSPAAVFFALGITVLTTFICGLTPALHSARRDLQSALTGIGKGVNGNFRHGKLRSYLIIAEIALSIVLLISSGLMMRTLLALERVDIGFNPANVFYARLSLPEGQYDAAQQKKLLFQKILDRATRVPGVLAAAETSSSPPYTWTWITVVARGELPPRDRNAALVLCSEGYFQTLEKHLLRGRLISTSDVDAARHVAVVNQTFAREHFKEEDPSGHEIRFSEFESLPDWPRDPYFEIIGVIEDAKNRGLQEPPKPEVYLPHTLTGAGQRGILVRSAVNPDLIVESIRREVATIDLNIAFSDAGTIERHLERSYYAGPQFMFVALCAVAIIGLVLVLIGIFSVMAYTVALQTHEIGIRMALGAQQTQISRMVLENGLRLIGVGVPIGLFASLALTRFLASQIWGVSLTDPWTYSSVVTLIVVVGLAACLLPARRAASVDPLIALRYE
jgi:putative ABC transport system permease protein